MVNIISVPSPNKYDGHSEPVTLIGIHTTETPEKPSMALAVANNFARVDTQASAHWVVDDTTRVQCVVDADSAWAIPPLNHCSLNIEQVGYAAQTSSDWSDSYSLSVLDNAAAIAADWCRKFDIPVRHLTDTQILNREKGFAGHVDVNRVFHGSDHTDPGPNYPWPKFLGLVNKHLGAVTIPVVVKPNCTPLQKAVRCDPDNQWGAITDQHCKAVMSAGRGLFPDGVAFTQGVVGANQDNVWGPKSKNSLTRTTKNVQIALHGMGFNPGVIDGDWGSKTQAAFQRASDTCHI